MAFDTNFRTNRVLIVPFFNAFIHGFQFIFILGLIICLIFIFLSGITIREMIFRLNRIISFLF